MVAGSAVFVVFLSLSLVKYKQLLGEKAETLVVLCFSFAVKQPQHYNLNCLQSVLGFNDGRAVIAVVMQARIRILVPVL